MLGPGLLEGAGAGNDHIYIASFGSLFENYTETTLSSATIAQPAAKQTGDLLVLVWFSTGGVPGPTEYPAQWSLASTTGGQYCEVYTRTCTNDANDVATAPGQTGLQSIRAYQMFALRGGSATPVVENRSTGTSGYNTSLSGLGWAYNSLGAGTETTNTFALGFYERDYFQPGLNSDVNSVNGTMNNLAEVASGASRYASGANTRNWWWGYGTTFQATSGAISAGELSYSVAKQNNNAITQMIRFKSV